jgi:hypothetical protein
VGRDGTIYTFGYVQLYALSASGAKKWDYPVGGTSVFSSPALDASEHVYVCSPELNLVYKLNASGGEEWTYSLQNTPGDSPAVGADGTVYVAAGPISAITSSGLNLWSSETNDFKACSPVVAKDGTIYCATSHGSLCAFTHSGGFKWQVLTNGYTPGTTPAIDSAGTIYYVAFSVLYAISPAGNVIWAVQLIRDPGDVFGTSHTSPTIGSDGTIYVASANRLYAIYNTNELADSAWPMYRQNARHTGKIEKPFLQEPKKRDDGNIEFQLFAQINQNQTVQASIDLVSWTEVANMMVTNVPMRVLDLSSTNFTTRFYRTVSR